MMLAWLGQAFWSQTMPTATVTMAQQKIFCLLCTVKADKPNSCGTAGLGQVASTLFVAVGSSCADSANAAPA